MSILDDIVPAKKKEWGRLLMPKYLDACVRVANAARPYLFDSEASSKLGEFIRDCPDIIIENLDFAKPPFPQCYIEVDPVAVMEAIGTEHHLFKHQPFYSRMGFLLDWEYGVIVPFGAIKSLEDSPIAGMYGYFDKSVKWDSANDVRFKSKEEEQSFYTMLLGRTVDVFSNSQKRALWNKYGGIFLSNETLFEFAVDLMPQHAGELLTVVAAMLLIHQKKKLLTIGSVPHRNAFHRGKVKQFMAHSVVTINVSGTREIRRAFGGFVGHGAKRAHEVAGHYAHRHGEQQCEHEWVHNEEKENQWNCPKCGRLRYFKRHHMRGDASKGYVRKTYEVTSQEEK